jgi:hypothetical protein
MMDSIYLGKGKKFVREKAHSFNDFIKVTFFTQCTARPANYPIAIGYKTSAFCGTPFKNFKNVPNIIQSTLWVTNP